MQQPLLRVQRFRRAAFQDGPYDAATRPLATNHEPLATDFFIHIPFELEDDENDQSDDKGDDAGHLSRFQA